MSGLPPIEAVPVEIRREGKQAVEDYRAALGFEGMLLGQLSKSLTQGMEAGAHSGAIEDAFTESLTAAGGLGLADELFRAIHVDSR